MTKKCFSLALGLQIKKKKEKKSSLETCQNLSPKPQSSVEWKVHKPTLRQMFERRREKEMGPQREKVR